MLVNEARFRSRYLCLDHANGSNKIGKELFVRFVLRDTSIRFSLSVAEANGAFWIDREHE